MNTRWLCPWWFLMCSNTDCKFLTTKEKHLRRVNCRLLRECLNATCKASTWDHLGTLWVGSASGLTLQKAHISLPSHQHIRTSHHPTKLPPLACTLLARYTGRPSLWLMVVPGLSTLLRGPESEQQLHPILTPDLSPACQSLVSGLLTVQIYSY